MCKDMLSAAALLRKALDNGWPVSGIDVEVQGNAFDLALGIAWLALTPKGGPPALPGWQ
jgi:hypothetical protein